jgi:hypothetical protein
MRVPTNPRNCQPSFRTAPEAFAIGSSMSAFSPPPTGAGGSAGFVSWSAPLRAADEHAEYSRARAWFPRRAFPRSPCPRTGAPSPSSGAQRPRRPASAPGVSRRAAGPRSRPTTAGFHGRRRADCVWYLFFPRSVGFGPAASTASGAFTIEPSTLCHNQAMPSISSYAASPRRHIFTNTPQRFHSRKYLWIELALPYSLGSAFHWQPVRRTYTMASNTLRGSMGLRPPPGRRLYRCPWSRSGFGIRGAACSHNASDTVHDFSAFMHSMVSNAEETVNSYLRISS